MSEIPFHIPMHSAIVLQFFSVHRTFQEGSDRWEVSKDAIANRTTSMYIFFLPFFRIIITLLYINVLLQYRNINFF